MTSRTWSFYRLGLQISFFDWRFPARLLQFFFSIRSCLITMFPKGLVWPCIVSCFQIQYLVCAESSHIHLELHLNDQEIQKKKKKKRGPVAVIPATDSKKLYCRSNPLIPPLPSLAWHLCECDRGFYGPFFARDPEKPGSTDSWRVSKWQNIMMERQSAGTTTNASRI